MLVFVYPDQENREELLALCPENEAGDHARAMIENLLLEEEEYDIAVCFCYGTFVLRRFYEGYEFTYPLVLEEGADVEKTLVALEEYSKRYEIPLVFADLTREEQGILARRYRYTRSEEFDVADEGEDPFVIYRLFVMSPCETLDTPPTVSDGEVTLSPLTKEDIPSYATLCRDEEILAVWGTDYREIDPDMSDGDFYENARFEFESGIALTLAIRVGGRLIGEATLYAFDGRGGAEFSLRILRGYRNNGYGTRALLLLFQVAREELGLDFVDGICLSENLPSIALMQTHMRFEEETEGKRRYRKML